MPSAVVLMVIDFFMPGAVCDSFANAIPVFVRSSRTEFWDALGVADLGELGEKSAIQEDRGDVVEVQHNSLPNSLRSCYIFKRRGCIDLRNEGEEHAGVRRLVLAIEVARRHLCRKPGSVTILNGATLRPPVCVREITQLTRSIVSSRFSGRLGFISTKHLDTADLQSGTTIAMNGGIYIFVAPAFSYIIF